MENYTMGIFGRKKVTAPASAASATPSVPAVQTAPKPRAVAKPGNSSRISLEIYEKIVGFQAHNLQSAPQVPDEVNLIAAWRAARSRKHQQDATSPTRLMDLQDDSQVVRAIAALVGNKKFGIGFPKGVEPGTPEADAIVRQTTVALNFDLPPDHTALQAHFQEYFDYLVDELPRNFEDIVLPKFDVRFAGRASGERQHHAVGVLPNPAHKPRVVS